MSNSKDVSKAAKKAAKAHAKIEKKTGAAMPTSHGEAAKPSAPLAGQLSPAERSAAAAERQVVFQKYRVWLAFLMATIALAGLLAAYQPWQYFLPTSNEAATVTLEPAIDQR